MHKSIIKLGQILEASNLKFQKQPSKGVLVKWCSEIMQQIYSRTHMKTFLWRSEILNPDDKTKLFWE